MATGTQTGRCTITRTTGGGAVDGNNVWHPDPPTLIYHGPCRVGSAPNASPQSQGDQQVSTLTYTVAIEWDAAEVLEGDTVTIDAAEDPRLAGKQLRVTNPRYLDQEWERVLACTDDITRREAR